MRIVKWRCIESSAIHAVAYDYRARVLHVLFSHGGEYSYLHVGKHRYRQLIHADSAGKYFNEAIRSGPVVKKEAA